MSAETVDLTDFNEWPAELREQWRDWVRHHGVDPVDVACIAIERRPNERQIRYFTFDLTARPVCEVEHVVQLEAEPSPFPRMPWS